MQRNGLSVFGLAGAVGLVAAALVAAVVLTAPSEGGIAEAADDVCVTGGAIPEYIARSDPGLVADCAALLALRDELRGTAELNWSASLLISKWQGVTMAGRPLRVTLLRLNNTGLNGVVPAGLGELSGMIYLDLSRNALTGEIPAELGELSLLRGLRLDRNKLRGAIPAGLAELPLTSIYLSGNTFRGCVPAALYKVTINDLRALRVSACATAEATPTPTPTATPAPTPTATPPPTKTYTVTATQPQNGALVVAPAAASYAAGAKVTVTARAATGYRLTAWGGDCAATAATVTTCALTMDADKTVSATFGKAGPGIGQSAPPELLAVTTGKAGEVLLEWSIVPVPAGVTGWQYRQQAIGRTDALRPKAGSWGAWTNVPQATAATRSHRVTGLSRAIHYFEVRAVAGSRTGPASASEQGRPAYRGADGIPQMLPGDIIEGGRTWRLGAGSTVVDVPAGTRLEFLGGALSGGRVTASFRDVASGVVQVVDIGRAEGVGRYAPPAPSDALASVPTRDVNAILDKIVASARLVPVK